MMFSQSRFEKDFFVFKKNEASLPAALCFNRFFKKVVSIFLFSALLVVKSSIPAADAATSASLYLSPSSGSFFVGSTFDVSILLNTQGSSINTIEVDLKFPQDKIQITNPSVGKSIIQIWATNPTFSNREGRVYFVGGVPSPGIKTSDGVVLTMTFRVIAPGSGEIRFLERSRVFANDGSGTNVLSQATHGKFSFLPVPPQGPQISSPTHPDQSKHYKNPNPTLIWTEDPGVEGFSYVIDQDPNGFPDTVIDGTDSSISYEGKEDGIWYFHVRAKKAGVWGGTSSFVIRIDTKPPAAFDVKISPSERTTTRRPIARFFTTDSLSGFDHFEMKVIPLSIEDGSDSELFFEVSSPHQFASDFKPGRYTVVVRAFDQAGNWRDEEVTINIISSFFQFITADGVDVIFAFVTWDTLLNVLGILVLILLVLMAAFWRRHHKHIKMSVKEDVLGLLGQRQAVQSVPDKVVSPSPRVLRPSAPEHRINGLEVSKPLKESTTTSNINSNLSSKPRLSFQDGLTQKGFKPSSFSDLRKTLDDKYDDGQGSSHPNADYR